jgi:hypothetical protein
VLVASCQLPVASFGVQLSVVGVQLLVVCCGLVVGNPILHSYWQLATNNWQLFL